MTQLMKEIELSIHRYYLPGDKKCKKKRVTNDMLQKIVRLAQDNFETFKGGTYEQTKATIGDVCRIAATNESETPEEERNGNSD